MREGDKRPGSGLEINARKGCPEALSAMACYRFDSGRAGNPTSTRIVTGRLRQSCSIVPKVVRRATTDWITVEGFNPPRNRSSTIALPALQRPPCVPRRSRQITPHPVRRNACLISQIYRPSAPRKAAELSFQSEVHAACRHRRVRYILPRLLGDHCLGGNQ